MTTLRHQSFKKDRKKTLEVFARLTATRPPTRSRPCCRGRAEGPWGGSRQPLHPPSSPAASRTKLRHHDRNGDLIWTRKQPRFTWRLLVFLFFKHLSADTVNTLTHTHTHIAGKIGTWAYWLWVSSKSLFLLHLERNAPFFICYLYFFKLFNRTRSHVARPASTAPSSSTPGQSGSQVDRQNAKMEIFKLLHKVITSSGCWMVPRTRALHHTSALWGEGNNSGPLGTSSQPRLRVSLPAIVAQARQWNLVKSGVWLWFAWVTWWFRFFLQWPNQRIQRILVLFGQKSRRLTVELWQKEKLLPSSEQEMGLVLLLMWSPAVHHGYIVDVVF